MGRVIEPDSLAFVSPRPDKDRNLKTAELTIVADENMPVLDSLFAAWAVLYAAPAGSCVVMTWWLRIYCWCVR